MGAPAGAFISAKNTPPGFLDMSPFPRGSQKLGFGHGEVSPPPLGGRRPTYPSPGRPEADLKEAGGRLKWGGLGGRSPPVKSQNKITIFFFASSIGAKIQIAGTPYLESCVSVHKSKF